MKQGRFLSNYQLIWETVRQIPKGKVATYGEVAAQTGLPGQARLVGYALHNLPPKSGVPWHRVINARGRISFPEGSSAYRTQRRLLRQEGVTFKEGGVDLERHGWLKGVVGNHGQA